MESFADCLKQDVRVGDLVLFHRSDQVGLSIGRVEVVLRQHAQIKFITDYSTNDWTARLIRHLDICKFDGEAATAYVLRHEL